MAYENPELYNKKRKGLIPGGDGGVRDDLATVSETTSGHDVDS